MVPVRVVVETKLPSTSSAPGHADANKDDHHHVTRMYSSNSSHMIMLNQMGGGGSSSSSTLSFFQNSSFSFERIGVLRDYIIGDIMIGTIVTAMATPFLTIVDKAIVQRSAHTHTILQSAHGTIMEILHDPILYMKSPFFLCMWATYAITFSTANILKTITVDTTSTTPYNTNNYSGSSHEQQQRDDLNKGQSSSSSSSSSVVFVGTTLVNTSASLVKDRIYTRLFSNSSPTTIVTSSSAAAAATVPIRSLSTSRIPWISYGFWLARDCSTIGATFLLPEWIHPYIIQYQQQQQTSSSSATYVSFLTQMITPMIAQMIAGPLHLLGLEAYQHQQQQQQQQQRMMTFQLNNNGISLSAVSTSSSSLYYQRWISFQKAIGPIVIARMIRIIPGYGFAGYMNREWRNQYQQEHHLQFVNHHYHHQQQQQ